MLPFYSKPFESGSGSIPPLKPVNIPSNGAELVQGSVQIKVVDTTNGEFAIASLPFGS